MTSRIQLHALYILSALAAAILALIAYTLRMMAVDAAGDGDVRAIDAGQITGLTLMFREVIGRIQSIWEHGERVGLTERLAESAPPGPREVEVVNSPSEPIPVVKPQRGTKK